MADVDMFLLQLVHVTSGCRAAFGLASTSMSSKIAGERQRWVEPKMAKCEAFNLYIGSFGYRALLNRSQNKASTCSIEEQKYGWSVSYPLPHPET